MALDRYNNKKRIMVRQIFLYMALSICALSCKVVNSNGLESEEQNAEYGRLGYYEELVVPFEFHGGCPNAITCNIDHGGKWILSSAMGKLSFEIIDAHGAIQNPDRDKKIVDKYEDEFIRLSRFDNDKIEVKVFCSHDNGIESRRRYKEYPLLLYLAEYEVVIEEMLIRVGDNVEEMDWQ